MASKRKCRHCKKYSPGDQMFIRGVMAFCDTNCAVQYGLANKEKGRKVVEKENRRELKQAKDKLKSRSDWVKEAQAAFNRYIRLRDQKEPCICCDRAPTDDIQWHAGHFLTTGARPEHRFNEDNCHKQTSYCNNHLSGNVAEYRKRLIDRIGLDRVEAMESDHEPKKYTVEDLKVIKKIYQDKCKAIERIN